MSDNKLGALESRFADIIWEKEPISSGALAQLALDAFGWKKTTAFTVLKRLCNRGLFQNQNGTVSSLLSRQEFYARQSEEFVQEQFDGSLPAFVAAFGSRKKLSQKELEELLQIIDRMRE